MDDWNEEKIELCEGANTIWEVIEERRKKEVVFASLKKTSRSWFKFKFGEILSSDGLNEG